jgi:hypothetical protein
MLQFASWIGGNFSAGDGLKLLLVVLVASLITLGIILIARTVARWGTDSSVPKSSPLWVGPDLVETTECARTLIDRMRQENGLRTLDRHPAVDELAQHHAHDMAERGFCDPIDPDGAGLEDRLVRLHPTMVGVLSEWERVALELRLDQPSELAESLLAGSPNEEQALAELALGEPLNCMGISVAESGSRVSICIVFAHHWATLIPDRPHLERPGTWPISAELIEGTTVEQLSAVLLPDGITPTGQVRAESFSAGEWEDTRVCAYVREGGNMDAARLQWYRLSAGAVPLPLP